MELFSASPSYFWTRLVLQRALAAIYLAAFLVAAQQFRGLIGEHGLLPARAFLERVPFTDSPSLFYFLRGDGAMELFAWLGAAAALFALSGFSEKFGLAVSALTWFFLWAVYLSFVNVGQTWYSFGWETMLLEAGFLAVFLGSANVKPPAVVFWMYRWMLFRVMFGAGLIKLRGDACWRDLSCLQYHFETQPVPNALSPWFHNLPAGVLKGGVALNHFVELIAPFGYFVSGPVAWTAGLLSAAFQGMLIFSGNLSFLNYLTVALCIPCLDDRCFAKFFGAPPVFAAAGAARKAVLGVLCAAILLLSVRPAANLFARKQMMNASFEPLHLVNAYGAFGSITRERHEIVIEGTADPLALSTSEWKEYEFYAKPGDPMRRPPILAPYHRRLDWLIWFAAMGPWQYQPWFLNLTSKLLQNEPSVLALIAKNPFPDAPPRTIRATLYRYRFAAGEERRAGAWWVRERERPYFPAVNFNEPSYRDALSQMGWLPDDQSRKS